MKAILKKLVSKKVLLFYHFLKANLAAFRYKNPSNRMVIVGITGTKGKSSTANFVWAGLTGAGVKVGLLSTANLRIGARELPNTYHMTMPNPFIVQENIARMADEECQIAVVETTSEGILQSRHIGINYDFLIFTNLTPEHIRSHGTFENYKKTKQIIFKALEKSSHKNLMGGRIPKVIIANSDSPEYKDFYKFNADEKYTYGIESSADIRATDIAEGPDGLIFKINGNEVNLKIAGKFNILNALPVFAIGKVLRLKEKDIIKGLETLTTIPGRMETIIEKPFRVIVDYAHEKESMTGLMEAARNISGAGKIIVLLGAEGGGRDKTKRPIMGQIVGRHSDFVIVSNVDPYEEPPIQIITDIAEAVKKEGKVEGKDLFLIEDRREGIRKALNLAQPGDLVLITGKGSEQSLIIGSKKVPWDDRVVTRDLIKELGI